MKRTIKRLTFVVGLAFMLSSCYTLTYSVGSGSQTGVEVKEKNHYLIYGLVPLETSDPTAMAGDASNYDVTVVHTFVDGLINAITFGIYSPTSTIVKK